MVSGSHYIGVIFHSSSFHVDNDIYFSYITNDRSTLINDLFGPHLAQFLIAQEAEPSEDPVKAKKKVHRKKKGNKDDTLPTPQLSPSSSSSTTTSKLSQNARKKLAKKQTI